MVFQSLLSTASTSASGFFGGGFGGSPPTDFGAKTGMSGAGGAGGAGGVSKDSFLMGSVRTFDDIPTAERSHRRDQHAGGRGAGAREWEEAHAPPTFGWWRWHRVEEGPVEAVGEQKSGATLLTLEQSLSSWEKDANEKLNHWQHAEEIKPLFRGSSGYGTYGTFSRRDFLYSAAACAPASAAGSGKSSHKSPLLCAQRARSDSLTGSETSNQPGDKDSSVGSLVIHTLRPGDTLSSLALKYQVQVNDIARANGISGSGSHASLLVRKSLRIPVLAKLDAGESGDEAEIESQAPEGQGGVVVRRASSSSTTQTNDERPARQCSLSDAEVDADAGAGYQSALGKRSEQAHAIAARFTAAAEASTEAQSPVS
jgi:LysM repeat protein